MILCSLMIVTLRKPKHVAVIHIKHIVHLTVYFHFHIKKHNGFDTS
jgi:hypothetical protein